MLIDDVGSAVATNHPGRMMIAHPALTDDAVDPNGGAIMDTVATASTRNVSSDSVSRRAADMAALVDRIQLLRTVLPALASDLADARREIRRLRRENARLKQRLTRYPVVPTGKR
jgi:hypothetical protein